MPGIQPPHDGDDFAGPGNGTEHAGYAGFEGEDERRLRARRLARYAVPVAVASLAAATIGIGTALATTSGGPSLPEVTARQLLAKMAGAKADTVSGSIRVSTDLGLPSALLDGTLSGAAGHGGQSAADPASHLTALLSGSHTVTVAADGPTRQRIALGDNGSAYTVVRDGSQLWAYDSAQHSVYHASGLSTAPHAAPATPSVTPGDAAAQILKALGPTTAVTVDGTGEVAGQAVYELVLTPKETGSTIGSIRVGVDAANGVPLSLTVLPASGGDAIADVAWTQVSFARPAASEFAFTTPNGAHVAQAAPHDSRPGGTVLGSGHPTTTVLGQGWTAIAELRTPKGASHAKPADSGLFASLGKPVTGTFGSGEVISTRVLNVLITDNGTVYAGAVTPAALVKAADTAK